MLDLGPGGGRAASEAALPPGLPEAGWYQALRLRERIPSSPELLRELPFDRDRAARRLERWLAQPPFSGDGSFDRRLAADGIERPGFLALLGEDPESLRQRQGGVPGWLEEILAAFREEPGEPLPWPGEHHPRCGGSAAFLVLVEPLVRRSCRRLRGAIADLAADAPPGLQIDPDLALRDLLGRLASGLRHFLARTLVLELQVARLEERLQGETPEQRFWSFVETLRQPGPALEILERYPVLARFVVEHLARWEAAALEMLRRLTADWEEIRGRFAPETDPGLLAEIESGQGDPHRGGRSVCLLRFASGFRLVYKPKSLAVDDAFQDLLRWLNRRGFEPGFRLLGILDRGPYGWLEHIETTPCLSPDEVRRFYQRQGAWLALLYLLEGTDFHHENLIAAGEHPVLIDLETLFHPEVNRRDLVPFSERPEAAIGDWVLRIGLLPQRVWGDAGQAGVDLSGLAAGGGASGSPPTVSYLGTVAATTDEMHMGPRQVELPAGAHRPSLQGREVSFLEHADDVFDGFRRLYGLLRRHREELSSPEGPLAAFAGAEVRVVFRQTKAYFGLFLESFHPYMLGSALDRARFLDRLWAGVEERPFLAPLAILEHRDLENGDIPFFAARPGSRDLWTSSGDCIPGFFPDTGLERVARRLARFGDADRERQEWLIRGAFSAVRMELGQPSRSGYPFRESEVPAAPERLLAAARAAADRLAALAFEEEGRAQWLSLEYGSSGTWDFRPVQPDFYLGLPGIAFALGYLGDLFGEERYTRLARLALASQRRILAERPSATAAIAAVGAFNGWGGLIHALTHLGALWNDPALLDEAEALAARLGPEIERDELSDLIAGAAGCLMALLGLDEVRPSEALRQLALRCGERLLERAQPLDRGAGWVVAITGPRPIAGMSHGAAGIALALLRLWHRSGDERFRRTALAALEYERSLYSPQHRNWPDLRQGAEAMEGEEGLYPCSWCHGAPGIGLARTAGLPFLDDPDVREEIRAAVETTLAEGFGKNHSLCHGDLGNLDLLVEVARVTGDAELGARVGRIAGGILEGIERHGWLYGLAGGAEPLGLMVGLAGIAYGLARLAAPERLPSVLTLAPPASAPLSSAPS